MLACVPRTCLPSRMVAYAEATAEQSRIWT
jgi:hypothetical protein